MCYARRQRSSWARIKLSKNYIISEVPFSYNHFRAIFILASFTLLSIYNSYWRDLYFALRNALYNLFCCSIFNDRLLPFFATAWLLYHIAFALSSTFLIFFKKVFFKAASRLVPLSRRLAYYTSFRRNCQVLFSKKIAKNRILTIFA